jgi:hypothetical protein
MQLKRIWEAEKNGDIPQTCIAHTRKKSPKNAIHKEFDEAADGKDETRTVVPKLTFSKK